jgi:hypothetical protein
MAWKRDERGTTRRSPLLTKGQTHRRPYVVAVLGLLGLSGLVSMLVGYTAADDPQNMPRTGSTMSDLVWELSQHLPAPPPPHWLGEEFEYVIAEGVVVNRTPKELGDGEWSPARSPFPVWGESILDVKRVVVANGESDSRPGHWTFIERHAYFKDPSGYVYEPWWGRGTMRYSKLRVGDSVIVVGVRKIQARNPLYSPDFWPHFSVLFNVVIREQDGRLRACIVAPSERTSDEFMDRDGLVSRTLRNDGSERKFHCYDVSADEAFSELVEIVKGRL